jgi:outer membrane immunogenic protein
MKKLLIGAVVLTTLSGASVMAADMPVKAPIAPAVAAYSWTGLYVNGGGGYGMWAADTTTVSATTGICVLCVEQRQGGQGWFGTVGAGFDYQVSSRIVLGVFGDVDFGSIKGTIQDQGPFFVGTIKNDWSWAVGGRAGWLVTPAILSYVNAGYSQAHFTSARMVSTVTGIPNPAGFATPAFKTNGWFIGGGVEAMFAPGWFWRNEYRYAHYGKETLPDVNTAGGAASSITFKPDVQTVRSEIVYKLNTPGGATAQIAAPAQAPVTWTGLYLNGGGGYGMWAADTTTVSATTGVCILCAVQTQGGKGFFGTVGAGFDYQASSRIVLGVFGDVDFASIKGTIQDQGPFFAGKTKNDRSWAAGARAGWLVTPAVLSYVNGGYSQAHFTGANMVTTFAGAATLFSTPDTTRGGWFIGGGAEAMVTPGWFWRNEYRYARYNGTTLTDTNGIGGANASITFKPDVQTVRSEVVYKFNFAGPVTARY